jgi:predicted enzyme related to lactoylglutathione lyase
MTTPSAGPWPGRFVWHDLMTKDGATAQRFYTALFDWQVTEMPMGTCIYRMIHCGPGPIGGIVEEPNLPAPPHWLPYAAVANVDAAAQRVRELGGQLHMGPADIPGTGRFAIVADPQGAVFAIYQGQPGSHGFDPDLGIPGRICWNEVYSTDDVAAQRFYTALFGWREEPKDIGPLGTYRVQNLDGKQAGGLMKNPMPGAPSCWIVYFFVTDLAAATAKAVRLGAQAMMENSPIPGVGAFSMLADPTGAMFALFQPSGAPC